MKRRFLYSATCIFLNLLVSVYSAFGELSGEEIMKRVDENEVYEKIKYLGEMTIQKRDKVRIKQMTVWAEGAEKAFIEFTNPEDRGIKYLRLTGELWIYFPEAEETIKISGHMLRESMMGSDFSYEDAVENQILLEKYSVRVVRSETIGDRDCYVLRLNAKTDEVTYAKRMVWVDKERFVVLKGQLFSLSDRLLKELIVENVEQLKNNRYFPTKVLMVNKLVKNSSTTFEMKSIEFDVDIPDDMFTKGRLER